MKFCSIHNIEHADFGVCRKCMADPVAGMLSITTTDGWILCNLCGCKYEPPACEVCPACDNEPSFCGKCGAAVVGMSCDICGEENDIYKGVYHVEVV